MTVPMPSAINVAVAGSAARSPRYGPAMINVRLSCETFYLDVQMRELSGRRIASADAPDGPSSADPKPRPLAACRRGLLVIR